MSGGLIGTNVNETLTGTNFASGAVVNVSGAGVDVSYATVTSSTSLSVSLFIDPSAFAGSRSVTVTTATGTSGAQPFTVSFSGAIVVSLNTDSNAGTQGSLTNPPGTGDGNPGDLRNAILNASSGSSIVFNTTAMCGSSTCIISLNGPLPPIENNITIDGGLFGRVIIDGAAAYRAFFVDNGTATLQNLQVQRALAQGGAAGIDGYSGGGGAGLGAGIFVNNASVNTRERLLLRLHVLRRSGRSQRRRNERRRWRRSRRRWWQFRPFKPCYGWRAWWRRRAGRRLPESDDRSDRCQGRRRARRRGRRRRAQRCRSWRGRIWRRTLPAGVDGAFNGGAGGFGGGGGGAAGSSNFSGGAGGFGGGGGGCGSGTVGMEVPAVGEVRVLPTVASAVC